MTHTTSLLRRVRSRIAATTAVEDLQRGAAVGAGVALVLVALDRFGATQTGLPLAAAAGLGAAALAPIAGFLVRRTDAQAAAVLADERLGLRERLSTSLWCASERGAEEPLAHLVLADADDAALRVRTADVARAFRPRVLRRPLAVAGVGLVACAALLAWAPAAEALETPDQKAARMAEQNRVAEVARKLEEATKKVEETAQKRDLDALQRIAGELRRATREMQKEPPRQQAALAKLNEMSDRASAAARKLAGMQERPTPDEMTAQERALQELLQDLAEAGIEALSKDVRDLEQRLKSDAKGDGAPSVDDLRAMAARVEALKRAIERAKQAGAEDLEKRLRNLGNEDLLEKIAQRMREVASKMERGEGYESMQGEDGGESGDLSDLSREELEQLLKDLEEMARLDDLSELMKQGGSECRGGRRLRFRPGDGT